MTALGTHEHFQCDQCHTTVRVESAALVGSRASGEIRPKNWMVLKVHTGGSRLEGIKHLCQDCRNSLDRHIFGPRRCDAPTIEQLEGLLKRARPLLTNVGSKDDYDFLRADINSYFNPGVAVDP